MSKIGVKSKRLIIGSTLVVVCFVLAGLIISTSQLNKKKSDIDVSNSSENQVTVDEIDVKDESDLEGAVGGQESEELLVESTEDIQVDGIDVSSLDTKDLVSVDPIVVNEKDDMDIKDAVVEEIVVEQVEEPEKPDLTPPEGKPETQDDLTDPDKVPEYDDEETTYIPEPEPEEPEEELVNSNLVPDSENPFLQDNIPSNGDGGEIDVEDVSDYEPGTGDKF